MKKIFPKSLKKPLTQGTRSKEKDKYSPLKSRLKTETQKQKERSPNKNIFTQQKSPTNFVNKYLSKYQEKNKNSTQVRYRSKSERDKYGPDITLTQLKHHVNLKVKTDRNNIKNLVESLMVIKPNNQLRKSRSRGHSVSYNTQNKQYIPKMTYAFRTKKGILDSNPYKPNQDSLLIRTKFMEEDCNLFAVADGHGLFGHQVSQFVAKNLSKLMQSSLKTLSPPQAFNISIAKLQNGLKDAKINAQSSGTTLNTILIRDNELYCANCGDSRAILITQNRNRNWQIGQLSKDHKPDNPSQMQRIIKCGGRVQPFKDQCGQFLGPARVWVGKQKIQGLAMSRSIGDNISKQVGVICQPQIIKHKLTQEDKFIIMGSDGLWQFISNEQVSKIILPYYLKDRIDDGIQQLLNTAIERWNQEQCNVIDDITIIIIFLNQ